MQTTLKIDNLQNQIDELRKAMAADSRQVFKLQDTVNHMQEAIDSSCSDVIKMAKAIETLASI
jgi:chromosome segregation ATPase